MRPTTIPDGEIWAGAQRIVMAPPDGDLTNDEIRPLEMLAEVHDGQRKYHALLTLEPGDLETIQAGGNIWLSFYGAVVPFCLTVAESAAPADQEPPMIVPNKINTAGGVTGPTNTGTAGSDQTGQQSDGRQTDQRAAEGDR